MASFACIHVLKAGFGASKYGLCALSEDLMRLLRTHKFYGQEKGVRYGLGRTFIKFPKKYDEFLPSCLEVGEKRQADAGA